MDGDETHSLEQANAELKRQIEETNKAMWALYKELDDKNAELERSNDELDQFAMIAGHDLQEPLRKVVAFGGRLKTDYEDALDERGRDYVDRMCNASARMLELTSDLMRYARVTSQAKPFEPTDLNAVAADVVSDLDDRIGREGGKVEIDTLPTIEADRVQMHQLLLNLIGNGLKFHRPEQSPVVSVSARHGGADTINISVSDNGIGFKEKFTERIFQPFRRLHGMGAYEGTGMGLAICKKIAVRHGGDIRVTSVVGEGSTFVITLPAIRPRADAADE